MNNKSQSATELLIIAGIVLSILVVFLLSSQQSVSSGEAAVENEKAVIFIEDLANAAQLVHSQGEGSTTTIYVVVPDDVKGVYFADNVAIVMTLNNGNTIRRPVNFKVDGEVLAVPGPQYITLKNLQDKVYMETTYKSEDEEDYEDKLPPKPTCSETYSIYARCDNLGGCPLGEVCVQDPPGSPSCTCRQPTCEEAWDYWGGCNGSCPTTYETCRPVLNASNATIDCQCEGIDCDEAWDKTGICNGACPYGKLCKNETDALGNTINCTCEDVDCTTEAWDHFQNCSIGVGCAAQHGCGEIYDAGGGTPIGCDCRPYCNITPTTSCKSGICPYVPNSKCSNYWLEGSIQSCECQVPCNQVMEQYNYTLPNITYITETDAFFLCTKYGQRCSDGKHCFPPDGFVAGTPLTCVCNEPLCGDGFTLWHNCSGVCEDSNQRCGPELNDSVLDWCLCMDPLGGCDKTLWVTFGQQFTEMGLPPAELCKMGAGCAPDHPCIFEEDLLGFFGIGDECICTP